MYLISDTLNISIYTISLMFVLVNLFGLKRRSVFSYEGVQNVFFVPIRLAAITSGDAVIGMVTIGVHTAHSSP